MAIIVSGSAGKDFTPAPEGTHQGCCVDVEDLGVVDGGFGPKPMVKIYWQISERMPNGKPFLVSRRYTASLHEKAALRKDLEAWRGRPFTTDELERFDLEVLIGVNCIIGIAHRVSAKGQTWANVSSLAALMKGMQKMAPEGYVRKKDRPVEASEHDAPPQHETPEPDDDTFDVGF